MSELRSSKNLLAPPTLIRARNPERHPSGDDPGVKSFPTVPCTSSYMNWEPGYPRTNAEFNRDFSKNSLPGEVLALALHLGVFGAGLHPDGPGCPEIP